MCSQAWPEAAIDGKAALDRSMLSAQLLQVIAVICTLGLAQAEDTSPAPLVQVNFYGNC